MFEILKAPENFFRKNPENFIPYEIMKQLQVGEMIIVKRTINRSGVYEAARRFKMKFKTKKYGENELAIVRVA